MNSVFIVSKKAVEEMGQEVFSKNPIGTGPYQLGSWKPKTHVELTSFDKYTSSSVKNQS